MRWTSLLLLAAAACSGDDDIAVDAALDAPAADAPLSDAGVDDDAPSTDGSTSDTSDPPDTSVDAPDVDEDCSTDVDEDGNGYGGCLDPICWDLPRCVDSELAEHGLSDWAPCGESVELDEDATRDFCEAGFPFPTERDFDCGRVPTTIRLDLFCQPDEGAGRALRYRVAMDLSAEDETLGPMSGRHTSFSAELGFLGSLYLGFGGGGSSSSDPAPIVDAWTDDYRASAWVVGQAGTQVIVLLGASSQTTTFTILEDGGLIASSADPVYFLTAGLDTVL